MVLIQVFRIEIRRLKVDKKCDIMILQKNYELEININHIERREFDTYKSKNDYKA